MRASKASEHHAYVGYSASPHPSSMQHKIQTTVCGSIVLGHLLSMRVIETTDRRAGGPHIN